MRKFIAGNWKMNGLRGALSEIAAVAEAAEGLPGVDVAICPPFTLIAAAIDVAGGRLEIGGQDCHQVPAGARTGCVSAAMLADLGAAYAIVGHSERRADQLESDAIVQAKADAAIAAGLIAILCVGETKAERDAGSADEIVARQIERSLPDGATGDTLIVAYEPVWAIGTGLIPTIDQVADMHAGIRRRLEERLGSSADTVRILYGGSVKPDNAAELLAVPNVAGALIGGASLSAAQFVPIIAAAVG